MAIQKAETGFKEIWKLFEETDKKFKETDRQFKETDKKIEETRKTVERTSKTVEKVGKEVSALTGKWGKFVEGMIAPGVTRLFKGRGIKIDTVYQRVKRHTNGKEMEIDILAVDGGHAVLIEAKSTLRIEDVNEHLERLDDFKRFFPEYKDKKVVGAVGGISIDEGSDKYAYKKGLYLIVQSGETVKISNDKGFSPKMW